MILVILGMSTNKCNTLLISLFHQREITIEVIKYYNEHDSDVNII